MAIRYLSGINVDSNTLFVDSANDSVGVGTNAPVGKLDVYAPANPSLFIRDDSAIIRILPFGGITYFQTAAALTTGSTTDLYFSGMFGAPVNMAIKASGNVGIGTTSPAEKLHAIGNVKIEQTSNLSAILTLNANSGALGTGYQWNLVGVNSAASYAFQIREASTAYLHINNSAGGGGGNVGIGTTSPAAKLDVVGTSIFSDTLSINTNKSIRTYPDSVGGYAMGITMFSANTSTAGEIYGRPGFVGRNLSFNGTQFVAASTNSGNNWGTVTGMMATNVDVRFITRPATEEGLNFGLGSNLDSITRMVVTTGGNVGIGTTSPADKLEISGGTVVIPNGQFYRGRFNGGTPQNLIGMSTGNIIQVGDFTSSWNLQLGGTTLIQLMIQNSEKVRINSDGNVGIGTTNPTNKLQVRTDVDNAYAVRIQGETNNAAGVWTGIGIAGESANTKTAILFEDIGVSYSRGKMHFALNNAEDQTSATPANAVMTLIPSGAVGIGTTNPGAKLHVSDANYSISSGDAYNLTVITTTPQSPGRGGTIGLGGEAGDGGFVYGAIQGAKENITFANKAGYLAFYTRSDGSNPGERMRITSAGNVGIGTTSPDASSKVTISSTNQFGLNLENTGTGGVSWQLGATNDSYAAGGGKFVLTYGGLSTQSVFTAVQSTGNIGIGTTTPGATYSEKLQVLATSLGRINVTHTTTSDPRQSDILFTENDTITFQVGTVLSSGTYGDQNWLRGVGSLPVTIHTDSLERLRVTSSGNVGIGTTSPGQKLTVDGTAAAYSAIGASDNVRTGLAQYDTSLQAAGVGGQLVLGYKYTNAEDFTEGAIIKMYKENGTSGAFGSGLKFQVRNDGANLSTKLILDPSGNLGVGTTSPSNPLHVSKDAGGSAIAFFESLNSDGYGVAIRTADTGNDKYVLRLDSNSGTTPVMYASNAGNVGIGTTSPGDKLQVDGTIWAKPTSNGAIGTALKLGVFTDSASTAAYEFKTNDSTDDFLGLYSNRWGINYEIHRDSSTGDKYVWAVYGDDGGHNMQLYNGSNTNSVRLSSFSSSWLNGGNVGIGTTSPGYKLEVSGNSYFSGLAHFGQTATSGSAFRWGSYGTAVSADTMLCMNQLWNGSGWTILNSGVGTTYLNLGGDVASPTIQFGTGPANTAATTKMIILNNGNVGIGTTSPALILDTASAARFYGVRAGRDFSIANRATVRLDSNGNAPADILFGQTAAANQIDWDGVYWSISSRDSGAGASQGQKFTIWRGSAHAAPNNSENQFITITPDLNMGVGTTTPERKLDVAGTFRATGEVTLSNYGAGFVKTSSTGVVSIDTTTYVPTSRTLTINGTALDLSADRSWTITNISGNAATATNVAWSGVSAGYRENYDLGFRPSDNTNSYSGFRFGTPGEDANAGFFLIRGGADSDVYTQNGITLVADAGWLTLAQRSQGDKGIRFMTGATSTTKVTILNNGNVGIGTTSPDTKLQVIGNIGVGAGTYNGGIYANSSTSAIDPNWGFDIARTAGVADYSTRLKYYPNTGESRKGGIYNSLSDTWVLYGDSNNTPNVIIPSGKVGIGTTAPLNRFAVIASNTFGYYNSSAPIAVFQGVNPTLLVANDNNDTDAASEIRLGNAQTSYYTYSPYIRALQGSGIDSYRLEFGTSNFAAATTRMTISAAGNVGIGTTNPIAKLHISSAGDPAAAAIMGDSKLVVSGVDGNMDLFSQDDNSTVACNIGFGRFNGSTGALIHKFGITSWANTGSPGSNTGNRLAFNYGTSQDIWSNSELMSITSGGSVGIGATSPGQKLTVYHNQSNVLGIYNSEAAYGTGQLKNIDFYGRWWSGDPTFMQFQARISCQHSEDGYRRGNLKFYTVQDGPLVDAMTILYNGNVGIGTANPGHKLQVQGTVVAFSAVGSGDNVRTGLAHYDTTAQAAGVGGQLVLGYKYIGDTDYTEGAIIKMYKEDGTSGNFGSGLRFQVRNNGASLSTKLVLDPSGNVGINTTSPSYKLDVVGDARITSGSLGVGVAPNATDGRIDASNDIVAYQTSDQRLKENVTPIENALEKVKSLTGVEFDWIEEHKHIHGYEGHDTGIIAQQVQAVMPTAVRTNDSGYLSVRYEKLIGLLIEANKELAARVEELEKKLK
jgi:hypothetical protein